MFFKTLALFATAVSAMPILPSTESVNTLLPRDNGGVNIVNNLDFPIYIWSVSNNAGDMQTLEANGGAYNENWRHNNNGGGVSIKLATKPTQDDVLQFEYTPSSNTIFWDMSCINMGTDSEFTKYGFAVKSSDHQCPTAVCHANDASCSAAYLRPDDNQATHGCPIETAFQLEIGQ